MKRWKRQKESTGTTISGNKAWKFSKSLQSWTIKHLFDRGFIKKSVFKKYAIEYVVSIRGQARKRVQEKAQDILNQSLEENFKSLKKPKSDSQELKVPDKTVDVDSLKKENEDKLKREVRSRHKRAKKVMRALEINI